MADDREKAHADRMKQSEADTKAAEERQNVQPTPTQEENDRAKLGIQSLEDLDNKEPDGSPEQKDMGAKPAAGYATRDAAPTKRER